MCSASCVKLWYPDSMNYQNAGPAKKSQALRRVGLFGPYVSRNLGDTATQIAVIQNLRRRCSDLQIFGIAPEPEDTVRSLGIPAFPLSGLGSTAGNLAPYIDLPSSAQSDNWRRPYSPVIVRRISRFVRTLDLLIISGGGQFDDFWGGAWNHPWSMLMWTALAHRYRIPVIYLAVGVDGLKEKLSRHFSIIALNLAQARFFRDARSLAVIRGMGFKKEADVCPDLVFALETSPRANIQTVQSGKKFVVISPISRKTWSKSETDVHDRYLLALIDAGIHLSARGFSLRIVCSQSAMDLGDARVLADSFKERGIVDVAIYDAPGVGDFLKAVRGAELVVASRLHGVILSLVAGCPVVALAHLDKVRVVMEDFGLTEYCETLQEIESGKLCSMVACAVEHSEPIRGRVQQVADGFRNRLEVIFDATAMFLGERSSRFVY